MGGPQKTGCVEPTALGMAVRHHSSEHRWSDLLALELSVRLAPFSRWAVWLRELL